MFEGLEDLAAAWRTIAHISEWTGLSVGMLAAGAGLVYLRPALLKPVILGAVGVGLLYLGIIHGDRVGRADVNAQWAHAKAKADAAQKQRDADIGRELEATYQPKLADLQKQSDERKARADVFETKISALLKRTPANSCLLGAAADRVRRTQR
jgi:hypothetical protein